MGVHKWVYLATSVGSSEESLSVLWRCCDCGAVEKLRPSSDAKFWTTVDDVSERFDHDD